MHLQGRRILVCGLMNRWSIAHAVGAACRRAGAEVAFTCMNREIAARAASPATELQARLLVCDLAQDEAITAAFDELGRSWERIDGIVHCVAFAPLQALSGRFVEGTDRATFRTATEISAYSLVALARAGERLLRPDASLVTLTFVGAERVVPFYNVMGVAKAALEACVRYLAYSLGPQGMRVNAVSAGPIRTASSLAVAQFHDSLTLVEREAPLRRNVRAEEVADAVAFLLSPLASGITGEVLHVDCGFHSVVSGLSRLDQGTEARP